MLGAEDITISYADRFALISATDRSSLDSKEQEIGDLYKMDLSDNNFQPVRLKSELKDFAPHGISFYKEGDTHRVMAINHTPDAHFIEEFELQGTDLLHKKTHSHSSMIRPNDLVMVDASRFYFTNDHKYTKGLGRLVEEYGGLAICNVVYYDGEQYREVAKGIAYANGINIDRKRNLLYVASVRGFLVKVYKIASDGSLSFIEDIPCGTGVDNIELDEAGNLWLGCHPNLLRFNAYAKGKREIAPSEIIKVSYRAKGDYDVEKVYSNDGSEMSGCSVAAPFDNKILVGNVMDDHFLVLERE